MMAGVYSFIVIGTGGEGRVSGGKTSHVGWQTLPFDSAQGDLSAPKKKWCNLSN